MAQISHIISAFGVGMTKKKEGWQTWYHGMVTRNKK